MSTNTQALNLEGLQSNVDVGLRAVDVHVALVGAGRCRSSSEKIGYEISQVGHIDMGTSAPYDAINIAPHSVTTTATTRST